MNRIVIFLLASCLLVVVVSAQKKMKPWTEWSEKEVNKMLNDSPWGQTQNDVNTSEMFYSPTSRTGGGNTGATGDTNDRSAQGALNQATGTTYYIRFFTAKPIRQAFARRIALQKPELADKLQTFTEQKIDDWIVIAVAYEAKDQRFSGVAMQSFNSANVGVLQNKTYLETKDGKRVFLQEYQAPSTDGSGAKFVFPRMLDNKPFITQESGYVRFYAEMGQNIKLNMRFKVSDMMYEGELVY